MSNGREKEQKKIVLATTTACGGLLINLDSEVSTGRDNRNRHQARGSHSACRAWDRCIRAGKTSCVGSAPPLPECRRVILAWIQRTYRPAGQPLRPSLIEGGRLD